MILKCKPSSKNVVKYFLFANKELYISYKIKDNYPCSNKYIIKKHADTINHVFNFPYLFIRTEYIVVKPDRVYNKFEWEYYLNFRENKNMANPSTDDVSFLLRVAFYTFYVKFPTIFKKIWMILFISYITNANIHSPVNAKNICICIYITKTHLNNQIFSFLNYF